MFKIGDFSKLAMVSVRMLRYYDEVGLFKPIAIDDFTGYRYYSASQIKTINLIVSLRNMGFNVSDITLAIGSESDEILKNMLSRKKNDIKDNILLEKEKLKKVNAAIGDIEKERVNMSYNVKMKSVPSYKVVALRDIIPTYDAEGILWARIGQFVEENKIQVQELCYATYYDKGYKDGEVDVEVVMAVKELSKDKGEFVFKTTEEIEKVASVLVPGDYSNIAPAFAFLGEWIEEKGYTIDGNVRQLPIKGPWNEKDVNNYLNEIQIPIK